MKQSAKLLLGQKLVGSKFNSKPHLPINLPHIERMGSPGRVKADRSVQYKYLNPHLVAVVTSGHDDTAGEKRKSLSLRSGHIPTMS